jgi:hypothetical protein
MESARLLKEVVMGGGTPGGGFRGSARTAIADPTVAGLVLGERGRRNLRGKSGQARSFLKTGGFSEVIPEFAKLKGGGGGTQGAPLVTEGDVDLTEANPEVQAAAERERRLLRQRRGRRSTILTNVGGQLGGQSQTVG